MLPLAVILALLSGYFQTAPATLVVRVRIDADARNRAECIVWNSEDGEAGQECWSLNGADAPLTVQKEYRDLPEGHYVVEAWVVRADKSEVHSTPQRFTVTGRN